jgi:PST family polysaccharide transporter
VSLIKISILNGIAVVIKTASAVIINKILAIYLGPTGYAIIGQFQNAILIIVNLAGAQLATGVTKITAEHFDNKVKQHLVWQTSVNISLKASMFGAILLFIIGDKLEEWLIYKTENQYIFTCLAIALPAMVLNNILLAIIIGKKETNLYVTINILGSLINMLLIGILAYNFGIYGALISLIISPVILLISNFCMVTKRNWFNIKYLVGQINKPILEKLSGFALMGVISTLFVPTSYIIIRDQLATSLGVNAAGYWQASWKISEIYLLLITSTLSIYYLPRLAEIREANELKDEIVKVYSFIMPFVIISSTIVYLSREFIVITLFTQDFLPIIDLFLWQSIGDVIKISSWIFSYVLISRAKVKIFIYTEIIFSILFVVLSWIFIERYGLIGVPIAYTINTGVYCIIMAYIVKKEIFEMEKRN